MRKLLAMLLAIVMMASVSHGFTDFADYYASLDANAVQWVDGFVVNWVGRNTADTLKADGYLQAEMVDATIAADSVEGVQHMMGYDVSKNYHSQVVTAITNSTLTWSNATDDLLNRVNHGKSNAEAKQAAYTWVVATQDAALTDPDSPTHRQLDWNRKARGDTKFRIPEEVEMIAVNEHGSTSKHNILTAMVPKVRAKMRAEGETFVGTEGRSNVVARLQVILDQLNSGSAIGIEATLRGYGVDCPDKSRTNMIARATILLPKIMDGSVMPDPRQKRLLQPVLGATEYELWRVAYNTGGSYTMP